MVICEVCKQELSQVNSAHLKKHNLTVSEYEKMYPNSNRYTNKIKPRKISFEITSDGCFICTSHKKKEKGYYECKINKKPILLHRFIYEQCFGFIEEGLIVRHKCDNACCINPEHLEVGTHKDNLNDSYLRSRRKPVFGEKHPSAKLTEKDVIEIIKELEKGESIPTLAKKYGVGKTAIYDIKKGNKWKHLTNEEGLKTEWKKRWGVEYPI